MKLKGTVCNLLPNKSPLPCFPDTKRAQPVNGWPVTAGTLESFRRPPWQGLRFPSLPFHIFLLFLAWKGKKRGTCFFG
jgi:hypothetical protein